MFYILLSRKSVESLNYEGVKKRASWTHFYVIKENDKIVACGAIGPYWNSLTESSLFTIYDFKNGELIYSDGHFAMEKFNSNYVGKTI